MSKPAIHGHTTHGGYTLKRAAMKLGNRVIDRRTSIGKALAQWQAELVADLGGRAMISTQERALVELCVRTKLMLDSVDTWVLQQPTLINNRKRALHPAVVQRTQLADALSRYLSQLGLKRRARPVESLSDYLVGRSAIADAGPDTVDDRTALPTPMPEGQRTQSPQGEREGQT